MYSSEYIIVNKSSLKTKERANMCEVQKKSRTDKRTGKEKEVIKKVDQAAKNFNQTKFKLV
jgi:hypothetical protein